MNNKDTIYIPQKVFVKIVENQESFIDYLKEPNTLVALSAIIISIITFIYYVNFNRKTFNHTITHNKLSVRPYLSHIHYLPSLQNEEKLILQNNGFGSAIIKTLTFEYKNKTYYKMYDLYKEHFEELANIINKNVGSNYIFSDNADFSLGANQSITLYEHKTITNKKFDEQFINTIHKQIHIHIEFQDIYQDPFDYYKSIN